jgi:hypothetical protein
MARATVPIQACRATVHELDWVSPFCKHIQYFWCIADVVKRDDFGAHELQHGRGQVTTAQWRRHGQKLPDSLVATSPPPLPVHTAHCFNFIIRPAICSLLLSRLYMGAAPHMLYQNPAPLESNNRQHRVACPNVPPELMRPMDPLVLIRSICLRRTSSNHLSFGSVHHSTVGCNSLQVQKLDHSCSHHIFNNDKHISMW